MSTVCVCVIFLSVLCHCVFPDSFFSLFVFLVWIFLHLCMFVKILYLCSCDICMEETLAREIQRPPTPGRDLTGSGGPGPTKQILQMHSILVLLPLNTSCIINTVCCSVTFNMYYLPLLMNMLVIAVMFPAVLGFCLFFLHQGWSRLSASFLSLSLFCRSLT